MKNQKYYYVACTIQSSKHNIGVTSFVLVQESEDFAFGKVYEDIKTMRPDILECVITDVIPLTKWQYDEYCESLG